jgi:hypothetical protein
VQQGEPARSEVAVAECVTPLLWPDGLAGYGWPRGSGEITLPAYAEQGSPPLTVAVEGKL